MRTISRYLLSEIAEVFAVGMVIITLIFFIQKILVITEWAINRGVGFLDILRLVIYLIPVLLMVIIPVVTLFAILLAVGRLSSDSEIIVMKAAGVGLHQLAVPVFLFASLSFLLTLYTSLFLLPGSNRKTRELQYTIVKTLSQSALPTRTFVEFLPDQVFYVRDKSPEGLHGVLIFQDFQDDDRGPVPVRTGLVAAEDAQFQHDPARLENFLLLKKGRLYLHDLEHQRDQVIEFQNCLTRLDLKAKSSPPDIETEARESALPELILRLRHLRQDAESGLLNESEQEDVQEALKTLRLELNERLAFPCACFLLALWALPLGLQNPRSGRLRPVILSMFVSILFYYLMILGKALALKGMISPVAAFWSPSALFLFIGIYLFELKRREKAIPVLSLLEEYMFLLQELLRKRRMKGTGGAA